MTGDNVHTLTENLFALDEPWRSRFLALLSHRARGWAREKQLPSREEVTDWLHDLEIYLEFSQMLDVWQGVRA